MDKKYCAGCRDNFYNGNNDIGVIECWLLKTAKLKTRYKIGWWTPTFRENFTKVRVPSCYKNPGNFYFADDIRGFPAETK